MKKQLLTAALMLTGMFALTPSVADLLWIQILLCYG